jgi:hypothetical protein
MTVPSRGTVMRRPLSRGVDIMLGATIMYATLLASGLRISRYKDINPRSTVVPLAARAGASEVSMEALTVGAEGADSPDSDPLRGSVRVPREVITQKHAADVDTRLNSVHAQLTQLDTTTTRGVASMGSSGLDTCVRLGQC